MAKVWFITWASRGFGRQWLEAALERGNTVAAAVRNPESLNDAVERYGDALLPIRLDVINRIGVFAAVEQVERRFGRIDVAVNNAGYGHFGVVEGLTEVEIRAQLETNFFGALWVTQAVLPPMRAAGSGHIVQVSTYGGVTTFPVVGAYAAAKWALEGLSQTLAQEVEGFGINVTLIEPGPYAAG
jgi:NAD(P)-dependent dehydrogenase (short-subunit alcohol dehydrogenase family)